MWLAKKHEKEVLTHPEHPGLAFLMTGHVINYSCQFSKFSLLYDVFGFGYVTLTEKTR